MEDHVLLEVNGSPLSVRNCADYLRQGGLLASTIGAIIRQHVLMQELDRHSELRVNPLLVDLVTRRFARDHGLDTDEMMEEWLRLRNQDAQTFRQSIVRELLIERLKHHVTEADLPSYFEARAPFLRRTTIERLEFQDWDMALDAVQRIKNGRSFEAVAVDQTQTSENAFVAETLLWVDLPVPVRRAADAAQLGAVLGPFNLGGIILLVRLLQMWSADLSDLRVRQALRDELFEAWIAGRIEAQTIHCKIAISSERPPA